MARAAGEVQGACMRCEVCENFRPGGDLEPDRKLVEVAFERRAVLLCLAHAKIAERSGVTTFEALADFYRESDSRGARSFVPRRARSAVSARPNERRGSGRRATDQ